MKKSESTAKLAFALAKAQGAMKNAVKDSHNQHFKSRYADMASVIEAIRQPLTDNGLSFVQGNDINDGNAVVIETLLMHESGEWLESRLLVPVSKWDAQGIGSAITYGRRYSLMAMVGIAADDDDGESAVGRGSTEPSIAKRSNGKIGYDQVKTLKELVQGRDQSAFLAYFGISQIEQLPEELYGKAIAMLKAPKKNDSANVSKDPA